MKGWRKVMNCCRLALGGMALLGVSAQETVSASDIQAREAYITGKPPRISPLQPGEYGEQGHETVAALRTALGLPPTAEVLEYVATMLRHPALLQRHVDLSVQLFKGTLSARDRELAILRTGWLCQAPYEWGEHVLIGKRVGFTSEEIERITIGSTAPEWDEHDRAILRAVEELLADTMISDETWAALARTFDEQQLLEFPILIGFYQGISYLQNSVRFRLQPDNPGLSAR